VSGTLKIGVCLRGAQVRTIIVTDKNLLHLPKGSYIPLAPLFFKGWPTFFLPLPRSPLHSLACSLNRLLTTPTNLTKKFTNMITAIAHIKGFLDHFGHSAAVRTSP